MPSYRKIFKDLDRYIQRELQIMEDKKFEGKPQPTAVEPESPYTCFLRGAVMKEDRPHFAQISNEKWFYCDNGHGRLSQAESYFKRNQD